MSFNTSEQSSTRSNSSTRPAKNVQSGPVTITSSKIDWRPGREPRKEARGKSFSAFANAQKERLLELRAALKEAMSLAANDTCPNVGDASALATHPGDAGTDACDRDLALRLLSLEQSSLHEIDEALRRIDEGTYGICEISGARIPIPRLKALPFARLTVECQARIERRGLRERSALAGAPYVSE